MVRKEEEEKSQETEYRYSKNRATQPVNEVKANSPYVLSNHLLCGVGEVKVDEVCK